MLYGFDIIDDLLDEAKALIKNGDREGAREKIDEARQHIERSRDYADSRGLLSILHGARQRRCRRLARKAAGMEYSPN